MINFAVKPVKQNVGINKYKNLVLAVTTIILVIYVVFISGLIGWKIIWEDRDRTNMEELSALTQQLISRSKTEVLVRMLLARSDSSNNFFDSRPDAYQAAMNLADYKIRVLTWSFDGQELQSAEITADDAETLKLFTDELSKKYSSTQINVSSWAEESGWKSNISVGGANK